MATVVAETNPPVKPAGVMDADYAEARLRRSELRYRLRTRAMIAAHAWRRYGHARPPRVLEIGAADGRTLAEIGRLLGRGEFIGIEADPGLIRAGSGHAANVRLLHGDALSLPQAVSERAFDLVTMLALLEHLSDPLRAVVEAFNVLHPGGLLVATCPNPFWDRIAGRLGLVTREHHLHDLPVPRLADVVRRGGFEVLEARRFMWSPVACLPYGRIPVAPSLGLAVDAVVGRTPLLRHLCVNGCLVARKPGGHASATAQRTPAGSGLAAETRAPDP